MGTWGTGIYSNDLATDLKPAVAGLAKLPFAPDQIVEHLCELFPEVASNEGDEDHSTFWFVIADQLYKKGIISERATKIALEIIRSGRDIETLRDCGMEEGDLIKRRKVLEKLESDLLRQPNSHVTSSKITKPKPLVLFVGETFAYPTSKGQSVNPYFSPRDLEKQPFEPDGFGIFTVIRTGHMFGYLPWYQLALSSQNFRAPPAQSKLLKSENWSSHGIGTLSAVHKERLMLQKLGEFQIRESAVNKLFPFIESDARDSAVSNISVANVLRTEVQESPKRVFGLFSPRPSSPKLLDFVE
jgi:hypothetical protein